MSEPREPTTKECTSNTEIGDGWRAIWYPQMGGYVGKAAFLASDEGCFDVVVWHDGDFPFRGNDYDPRTHRLMLPAQLHHCDPEQFIRFGETVNRFVQQSVTPDDDERPLGRAVYLVEHGEYEQRAVVGVHNSVGSAVASLKRTYGAPYVVTWGEVAEVEPGRRWTITGDFERVDGYSTKHVAVYEITHWEVDAK